MFSNLKVNNSDSGNIMMSLKQDHEPSGMKTGNADFYSMVMSFNQETSRRDNDDRKLSSETSQLNNLSEKSRTEERIEDKRSGVEEPAEKRSASEKIEPANQGVKNEDKPVRNSESLSAEKDKKAELHDVKEKKKTEHDDILQSAAVEMLVKKISEILQGGTKINSEDFSKKLRKAADDVLAAIKKNLFQQNEQKAHALSDKFFVLKDAPVAGVNDFIEKLGREFAKMLTMKKGSEKGQTFSAKDIKDAIGAVVEDIKKGKTRNTDRSDIRRADAEEHKTERKNEVSADSIALRKKENGNESSQDMNFGKDKNSSREGGSFSAGKHDVAWKSGVERNEAMMKSPEFRQSLQEIIDKARISVKDSSNATFTVKLFPKELGSVNVNLFMENGVVSGRFLVDSDETKSLLMNNLASLKEQLADAGINVGEFNVNVNQQGQRFASKEQEEKPAPVHHVNRESEAAVIQYDNNSSAAHNGHINMVI